MNLSVRSNQKELLDADNIPFNDIKLNMHEIDRINHLLGGHAITIKGFKKLLGNRKKVHVCEIGCGDGNNLVVLHDWSVKNDVQFSCTGVDIKKECIEAAQQIKPIQSYSQWITSSYESVDFQQKPDIIFSSLFCHHFTEEQLVMQLNWMKQNSTIGFFINDLQRNALAYYSIKMLTKIFSKSYLVKNDAPLSVARGFYKNEWRSILYKANILNAEIKWQWAFRYLITYKQTWQILTTI